MKANNKLDAFFKENLHHHEQLPNSQNWDNIQKALQNDTHEVDTLFQKRLHDLEVDPLENHWEQISLQIPLNLWVKRRLYALAKIAAVLLIGMFSILFTQFNDKKAVLLTDTANQEEAFQLSDLMSPYLAQQKDALKAIQLELKDIQTPKSIPSKKAIKVESKFEKLLADDDLEVDKKKMEALLAPINSLSYQNATTSKATLKEIPSIETDDFRLTSFPPVRIDD